MRIIVKSAPACRNIFLDSVFSYRLFFMSTEWGLLYRGREVYVMGEAAARESANADLKLVCKIKGEWVEVIE